uniref:Ig-like domain-containing protein n=1 Tax=Oryzias latipes TaxID=8090 RepID=A0A3B3IGX6_ORYLA
MVKSHQRNPLPGHSVPSSGSGGSPILGYVVEAQKSGTAQWNRINKDLIKMCAYRVPGLVEGMEYRIRIRAANQVGESEPRELAETIVAKDILVPPEVVVDVSCRDALTVRAGQIISLICRVKGRPDPEITWTKDARALSRDKRTEINSSFPLCELVISDAIRSDYGKYAICAKNSSGQAQATIVVNRNDDNLKSGEGQLITQQRHHFQLEISNVTKEHTGTYTVLAENASGSKTAEIQVNVLGEIMVAQFKITLLVFSSTLT